MACGCAKKKAGQFEVIASNGRTVFTGNQATATTVAKRYPDSKVQEVKATDLSKPKTTPVAKDGQDAAT
ncbi:hypothetical protein OV450_1363 [Actinobacteria bacterium OV450]|nr:hypothetical protein OV450_1363 [Actinobacteria bacterium OV450]